MTATVSTRCDLELNGLSGSNLAAIDGGQDGQVERMVRSDPHELRALACIRGKMAIRFAG